MSESRRRLRSMVEKPSPKPKAPKPQTPANDSTCDPLGFFCVLPTEIIHEILTYIPIRSIATLAMVSHQWQNVLGHWMESKRTLRRLRREMNHCCFADQHNFINTPSSFTTVVLYRDPQSIMGDLVRRIIMRRSVKEKVEYVEIFLKRIFDVWPLRVKELYKHFGSFLRTVLKASNDEDVRIAVEAVFSKVHLGFLPPNECTGFMGHGRPVFYSGSLRSDIKDLFPEKRSFVTAVDLICGKYSAFDKADFVRYFFGFDNIENAEFHPVACLFNKWWNESREETMLTIQLLFSSVKPELLSFDARGVKNSWGPFPVAYLLEELQLDLAIRLLLDDSDKMPRVLKAMAEINGNATVNLIHALRGELADGDFNELVEYMLDSTNKEIDVVSRRCRIDFSSNLSAIWFQQLHNLEIVKMAIGKMKETDGVPKGHNVSVDLHQRKSKTSGRMSTAVRKANKTETSTLKLHF